jgi:DNA-binding transcriptional regulator GbsR (MarR family)
MKHTEVPRHLDDLKEQHILEHGDKIIYGAIRNYMNDKTRECYPAIATIAKILQCSPGKINAAIKRLVSTNLLLKHNDGKKNHYVFPRTEFDKHFEMFTEDFWKLDLPLNVKEYYMDIQPFLYGKESGTGRCSFSNAELSRRTGWTVASIKKYNTILIEKNFLTEESTNETDAAGLTIIQKNFNLTGLQQAALWVKAVTEQVSKNTDDIEDMKRELEELKAWKARKEREESLERNRYTEPGKYNFD